MTADEGPRPSPDDETPANDSPSTPSTSDADDGDPEARSTGRADSEAETTDTERGATASEGDTTTAESDTTTAEGSGNGSTFTSRDNGEERRAPDPVPGRDPDDSFLRRLWSAESGPLFFVRELGTSAGAVVLVGLVLFGVSGVWPPMVAVESGSMEPHMHKGDLVFITEPGRYTPDAAYGSTGVVTAETGADVGYRTFGGPGSVVVYDDPGEGGPPIIHRAEFYVKEDENWYDRADSEFVSADDCRELRNCPAPHAGFITKGDANGQYDQASGIAGPVRPSWITGVARIRIPYLGWVRLGLADAVRGQPGPVLDDPNQGVEPTRSTDVGVRAIDPVTTGNGFEAEPRPETTGSAPVGPDPTCSVPGASGPVATA